MAIKGELVDKLLFAAQALVADADYHHTPSVVEYRVSVEAMEDLKKVVQEISDDAVARIQEAMRQAKEVVEKDRCRGCGHSKRSQHGPLGCVETALVDGVQTQCECVLAWGEVGVDWTAGGEK